MQWQLVSAKASLVHLKTVWLQLLASGFRSLELCSNHEESVQYLEKEYSVEVRFVLFQEKVDIVQERKMRC